MKKPKLRIAIDKGEIIAFEPDYMMEVKYTLAERIWKEVWNLLYKENSSKKDIVLILEEGEVTSWQANGKGTMLSMKISQSLAKKIWLTVAKQTGKENMNKLTKEQRTQNASAGGKKSRKTKK